MASKGWTRGKVIGRGSTATVSIASVNDTGELFAVKSAELSKSSPLQREQSILSSFQCDNVVSCLGHDISDGQYNLFLEYAPGGSLSDYIASKSGSTRCLSEADIRSHTREVLAGLAFLHSRKIVHCDVKSRNILIGADGKAKIADLGCAKAESEEVGVQFRGTPMFMAPEVARGERQGTAADIWAVGCVAVEMATGRAPWPESSDAISVLHRIAFSADVPEVPGWVSEEGKDFLGKCLRRDAEERWTAEQLLGHPFLLNCADSERKWTSPKSVLDQRSIWESPEDHETDDDDDEEELSTDGPRRMMAGLVSGRPRWNWDENWLAVRVDNEVIEEKEEEDTVDDESAVVLASRSTSEDRVSSAKADSDHANDESELFGDHSFRIVNLVINMGLVDCVKEKNKKKRKETTKIGDTVVRLNVKHFFCRAVKTYHSALGCQSIALGQLSLWRSVVKRTPRDSAPSFLRRGRQALRRKK